MKIIIYVLIGLIQGALIIASFVVNDLTAKRAGVMRHVYTRRMEFEQSIFSHDNLLIHDYLLIALSLLLVALLIYVIKKRKRKFTIVQLAIGLAMSLSSLVVINSSFFKNMLAHPYFIIAFELALLIQIIVIAMSKFFEK